MDTSLDHELQQAQENMLRKSELKKELASLQTEKVPYQEKTEALYKQLQKEDLDVEKLEGMSFRKFLYAIINQLVEKTEQEKKEAVAAKLKYDIAKKELDDIDTRISEVREKLEQLKNTEEDYNKLYLQKNGMAAEKLPTNRRKNNGMYWIHK